jgi:hypothetical protein
VSLIVIFTKASPSLQAAVASEGRTTRRRARKAGKQARELMLDSGMRQPGWEGGWIYFDEKLFFTMMDIYFRRREQKYSSFLSQKGGRSARAPHSWLSASAAAVDLLENLSVGTNFSKWFFLTLPLFS